ncbi:MAG: DUF2530 domain-containing protein [Rhodococcus sp. (in: high G+C Gram-positive bacteria)]
MTANSGDAPTPPPTLPSRWTDPAPAIAVGTAIFLIAAVVCSLIGSLSAAAPTCWAGTVLGAAGFALFAAQRRAARSGSRTAQRGLVDRPKDR